MFFILVLVLALALFSTAVAYILYFRLIQNVGSTKALTVTYLIPVFALDVGCSHPEGANQLVNGVWLRLDFAGYSDR